MGGRKQKTFLSKKQDFELLWRENGVTVMCSEAQASGSSELNSYSNS